jgi:geranylgeranyl diphosphate synthase type II
MEKKEFDRIFQEKQQCVEELLRKYLPGEESYQKTIFQAMEYSLMAGGKRLRPILMQEAFALFGGGDERILHPFMAAMEMIHTYSLVHDDLPAMDDDDYRRGKKTTHVVFGEDMGILAGDALLNYAYETASRSFSVEESLPVTTKAFQILGQKAGIYGMVGGQVVDVEQTGKPLTQEVLSFIYQLKTGALLEASLMIGGTLAGAAQQEIDALEQIGSAVGMAFQIQDDILDCTSTTQELGKPVHSDEKNEKTTYVSLYGLEKSREAVEQYSQKAIGLLESMENTNPFLSELVKQLISRKK